MPAAAQPLRLLNTPHRRFPGLLLILLALAGTALFGCAQSSPAPPTGARSALPGVQVLRDLEYVKGGHARNRLDLYLPEKASRPLPVILWVHGGGWKRGDKTNGPAFQFATRGYAVASMNYRFSQDAVFPAQIYDCKAAVRWLRAPARQYGLDARHIGAWGGSAGGHLVALLGTTAGIRELEGPGGNADQSSRVQAVVDWYGPTVFLTARARNTRHQLFGGDPRQHPEKARQASPLTYVSKDAAPFLIMHGDQDQTVKLAHSEILARALKRAGAEVTLEVIKGGRHGGFLFTNAQNLKRVEAFFDRHLKGDGATPPPRAP